MAQVRPEESDRLELVSVRLGSGKVYLVPRALLENLVNALPVSAPQLIVSASTTGGPLDPSGLPSEAGRTGGGGSLSIASKSQSDLVFQDRGGGLRDEKGPPKGSLTRGAIRKGVFTCNDHARRRRGGGIGDGESMDMLWTCYGHAKTRTWPHYATF